VLRSTTAPASALTACTASCQRACFLILLVRRRNSDRLAAPRLPLVSGVAPHVAADALSARTARL
jgi:hypothetical protein